MSKTSSSSERKNHKKGVDMHRNSFKLMKLFFPVLFLITACVIDIENPIEESLSIEWISIDYDQVENQLFLQLEILPVDETIDSITVEVSSENYDSTFVLNDNGVSGDLIAENNRFSAITEVDLPFEDYQFEVVVYTLSLKEYQDRKNITIDEEFPPEIVDIIFWQKNADGSGIIFNPDSEVFQIDDIDYRFLDFQLIINDRNNLEDIRYVRYQINVEAMEAEDSCQYVPETGYLSYPQWYLEYKETNDLGFVFDVKNEYLDDPTTTIDEPGIPIKPIGFCGRIGVSTFRFIIADMTFEPVVEEINVGFDK